MTAYPGLGVGPMAPPPGAVEPPPPPGPGVTPPFAAPPADRDRRRLWIGLGAGAAVLLLCCVGGLVGLGVVIVSAVKQGEREATTVVTTYLDAMRAGEPETAYDQLCRDFAATTSVADLQEQIEDQPIESFQLGEPELIQAVEIDAQVRYDDGSTGTLRFFVDIDRSEYRICDIEER